MYKKIWSLNETLATEKDNVCIWGGKIIMISSLFFFFFLQNLNTFSDGKDFKCLKVYYFSSSSYNQLLI